MVSDIYSYHHLLKKSLWRQMEQHVWLAKDFPLPTIVNTRQCPSAEAMGNPAFARLDRPVLLNKTLDVTEFIVSTRTTLLPSDFRWRDSPSVRWARST